jgi:DNA-binding transcriptional MocR family regulator
MSDPLLRDLLDLERPGVVSLGIGLPGRELLPLEDLRDVQDAILSESGADAFLHSPTEGTPALREAVAAWMGARGVRCTPSQVMITTGSQQGLDLISRVFLAPGDLVVMEDPGYLGAILTFRRAGVRIAGVPVDREGMRVEAAERVLARQRPKLIYTVPTFQNPTGTEMSLARREHLLALAARYQVPVLEEEAYGELRYEGQALPSLLSLDRTGSVLHLATSSKMLFPGLRVGWLVGPESALHPLAYAKQTADLHTSTWAQLVAARFLSEGRLERHLRRMRREYARRRDTLVAGLAKAPSPGFSFATPRGGFYVWCRLPDGVPTARLMTEAAHERVSFLPGTMFSPGTEDSGFVRLNFSGAAPDRLREGAARLTRALTAALAEVPAARRSAEVTLRPIV